jgi:hypothetical protein
MGANSTADFIPPCSHYVQSNFPFYFFFLNCVSVWFSSFKTYNLKNTYFKTLLVQTLFLKTHFDLYIWFENVIFYFFYTSSSSYFFQIGFFLWFCLNQFFSPQIKSDGQMDSLLFISTALLHNLNIIVITMYWKIYNCSISSVWYIFKGRRTLVP